MWEFFKNLEHVWNHRVFKIPFKFFYQTIGLWTLGGNCLVLQHLILTTSQNIRKSMTYSMIIYLENVFSPTTCCLNYKNIGLKKTVTKKEGRLKHETLYGLFHYTNIKLAIMATTSYGLQWLQALSYSYLRLHPNHRLKISRD